MNVIQYTCITVNDPGALTCTLPVIETLSCLLFYVKNTVHCIQYDKTKITLKN